MSFNPQKNFVQLFEESFKQHWNLPAYTDFGTDYTLNYSDVATWVEKIHILFEQCGIKKDDKVALIGRNSANWCVAYVATITYGAVIVPILQDFTGTDVQHILQHSESKLLFTADYKYKELDNTQLGDVKVVVSLTDFEPKEVFDKTIDIANLSVKHLTDLFTQKYPQGFAAKDIKYNWKDNEELAVLSYTSGTTGNSKAVMSPGRAMAANAEFGLYLNILFEGDRMVTFLPLAHAYGCAFDFLGNTYAGGHTYLITTLPIPKILLKAFAEIKPTLILSVPLIIEKVYRSQVLPKLQKAPLNWLIKIPGVNKLIYNKIRKQLVQAFGGEFYEFIIGGAAMNPEIEAFFHKINFPFTIGYGMTETAPLISYRDWKSFKPQSCGRVMDNMEAKIDKPNAQGLGEIVVKGPHVMLGYYKNEEATKNAFTKDGWLRTGDLGEIDAEGNIFIKGRCKTMLLGPSGQNIFPEEIEDVLNNLPFVAESLVVQRDNKLIGLIVPDTTRLKAENITDINAKFEELRKQANKQLPQYEQIVAFELQEEEFKKTPKNSIKRYLYN
ncbi:MAG: AMP-binding protein [Paludibacteraceae bacterium]|nr:AMP-binding protein [Paludibacteraceae bacterium]